MSFASRLRRLGSPRWPSSSISPLRTFGPSCFLPRTGAPVSDTRNERNYRSHPGLDKGDPIVEAWRTCRCYPRGLYEPERLFSPLAPLPAPFCSPDAMSTSTSRETVTRTLPAPLNGHGAPPTKQAALAH